MLDGLAICSMQAPSSGKAERSRGAFASRYVCDPRSYFGKEQHQEVIGMRQSTEHRLGAMALISQQSPEENLRYSEKEWTICKGTHEL